MMQRPITGDVHLGQIVNTNDHTGKVKPIDISSSFNEITRKLGRLHTILKKVVFDRDALDYLPDIQSYQGKIYGVNTKRRYAKSTYNDT